MPRPAARSSARPPGASRRSRAASTPPRTLPLPVAPASAPQPPGSQPASQCDWLSLTELGRLYGISAVQVGRLLVLAGLRQADGQPSDRALRDGIALCPQPGDHHQALWSRHGCAAPLQRHGLELQQQRSLVGLWADLLSALQQGSPSICVSAEEMADDMPQELVRPVNRELRQRGCSFQVRRLRTAAAPRPACSPAPAADAAAPRPCD